MSVPHNGAEPRRWVASSEPAVFLFAHNRQPTASQGGAGARAG